MTPVIGGALTAIGVSALLAPMILWSLIAATLVAAAYGAIGHQGAVADAVIGATPILLVVAIASLIGGYVAGSLDRHARARSAGAASLLGLLLVMLILAIFVVDLRVVGGVIIAAAVLGIPVAVLFGRLGGVLAPRVAETRTVRVVAPTPLRERLRLRPAFATGRKGGERTEEHVAHDAERTSPRIESAERHDARAPRPEDRRS